MATVAEAGSAPSSEEQKGANDVDVDVELGGSAEKAGTLGASSRARVQLSETEQFILELNDISYTIRNKDTKGDVTLVHPLSLKIKPKEMMAIMGSSGAGKSTLLDILSVRVPPSALQGEYLVNGKPIEECKHFKRVSAYVMQSDALYPLLTVRETMRYAALLRIGGANRSECYEIAEEVLTELRLLSCAETVVGDEEVRGISGGEKRRVSIGVDIVSRPSVLFLDEPTSGLDSTTARQVTEVLQSICVDGGRTVAMTIHQPSMSVFNMFARVVFLSKGRLVYNGTPEAVPNYVTNVLKMSMPQFTNTPEAFLDLTSTFEADAKTNVMASMHSDHVAAERVHRMSSMDDAGKRGDDGALLQLTYANNMLVETFILSGRSYKSVLRTPALFFARFGLSVFMGFIVGTLFFSASKTVQGYNAMAGANVFGIALYLFTSMEAMPVFMNEKAIFVREQSRGAYRAASFSIASLVVYTPFSFIMAGIFTTMTFFLIDEPGAASSYFFLWLQYFLVILMGSSFATFISSIAPDALRGNSMGTALLSVHLLFCGYFLPKTQMPKAWQWFNYFSMFKYPYESILSQLLRSADGDLKEQVYDDLGFDSSVSRWRGVWVMIIFIIGWRVLFYAALKKLHTGMRN